MAFSGADPGNKDQVSHIYNQVITMKVVFATFMILAATVEVAEAQALQPEGALVPVEALMLTDPEIAGVTTGRPIDRLGRRRATLLDVETIAVVTRRAFGQKLAQPPSVVHPASLLRLLPQRVVEW